MDAGDGGGSAVPAEISLENMLSSLGLVGRPGRGSPPGDVSDPLRGSQHHGSVGTGHGADNRPPPPPTAATLYGGQDEADDRVPDFAIRIPHTSSIA